MLKHTHQQPQPMKPTQIEGKRKRSRKIQPKSESLMMKKTCFFFFFLFMDFVFGGNLCGLWSVGYSGLIVVVEWVVLGLVYSGFGVVVAAGLWGCGFGGFWLVVMGFWWWWWGWVLVVVMGWGGFGG